MANRNQPPCIFPTFRYTQAATMIDWLQQAFGFIVHAKHMDGDSIAHAELDPGSSIIILGEVRDDDYVRIVGMPRANGGKSTYIAIKDADALYARAKDAGVEILEELTEREYGSREFICRDPGGQRLVFRYLLAQGERKAGIGRADSADMIKRALTFPLRLARVPTIHHK